MVKSSLPIKCDFTNCSSEFHLLTAMDAQFGHTPPEDCVGATSVSPLETSDQGHINDTTSVTANNDTNMVNDLSSSDEEDMVDTLSSPDEEEMVTS